MLKEEHQDHGLLLTLDTTNDFNSTIPKERCCSYTLHYKHGYEISNVG